MIETDDVLLEQARRNQDGAFTVIYDRYALDIYRYLYRLIGDAWVAEDLTSDVFLKLLHTAGTSTGPRKNLRGWLYRVARNLGMDWFRGQTKVSCGELREDLPAEEESSVSRLVTREQHSQLGDAIRQLTPDQQQVILLRFGEGLEIKTVGRIMDKSEGAVKVLQYRAVRRLKSLLQPGGVKSNAQKTGEPVRSISTASSTGRNR